MHLNLPAYLFYHISDCIVSIYAKVLYILVIYFHIFFIFQENFHRTITPQGKELPFHERKQRKKSSANFVRRSLAVRKHFSAIVKNMQESGTTVRSARKVLAPWSILSLTRHHIVETGCGNVEVVVPHSKPRLI